MPTTKPRVLIRTVTRNGPFSACKLRPWVVAEIYRKMAWYWREPWCVYPRNLVLVLGVGMFVLRFLYYIISVAVQAALRPALRPAPSDDDEEAEEEETPCRQGKSRVLSLTGVEKVS